jgi:hypothetical protein
MQVDFTEQLDRINSPALVFWGNKDAFCFFKGQETLVNNIINSSPYYLWKHRSCIALGGTKKILWRSLEFYDDVIGTK